MMRIPGARCACLTPAAVFVAALWGCSGGQVRIGEGEDSVFQLFAGPSPGRAAILATDEYDPDNRFRGTLQLGAADFAREPVYLELFTRNAEDRDPRVRAAAIRALGNNGRPEHARLIIEALTDDDELVRFEAAHALQRIYNTDAIGPLLDRLGTHMDEQTKLTVPNEPNPFVRAEVAHALGQYADRRVLYGLIGALRDNPLGVNVAARRSLRILTGQDFEHDEDAWLAWLSRAGDPFAARQAYLYPIFHRPRKLVEYIPLVPGPPNEIQTTPIGYPPLRSE